MNLKLKRTPGIYLVGFMASGKTTIGRMYADEIGWGFADLDSDIEADQKATISELFARVGEQEFRRIATPVLNRRLDSTRRGVPTVLAVGGGTFTREENIELLEDNGITVWIDTPFSIVQHRARANDERPLARDPKRFEQLFHERRAFYRRAAYHVHLTTPDSRRGLAALLELCLLD